MSEYLTSCIMSGIYHMFDFRSITTSMSFFIHTKNAVWIWVKSTEYLQLWSIAQAFLLVIFVPYEDWGFLWLFSHSVMSDSLRPHGLQHARLPCPSPIPKACSNSCPLSQWCHPTISSSVFPFSTCLQSFPVSGSFPMSWLIASGFLTWTNL